MMREMKGEPRIPKRCHVVYHMCIYHVKISLVLGKLPGIASKLAHWQLPDLKRLIRRRLLHSLKSEESSFWVQNEPKF